MTRVRTAMMMAALAPVLIGSAVSADQWNDKTILTFSEPVMVPDATLPPGTYVFKLADVQGNRHLVQIFDENEQRLITTTQAVPTQRQKQSDDVLVRFNPTSPGSPVAIQAWFAAESTYGHEFVYPEEQARQIADRTRSVVLSVDVPGSDLKKGTLRTVSPGGERSAWMGDAATLNAWSDWQRQRSAASATPAGDSSRKASATVVQTDRGAMRVRLDDLESNYKKYLGQCVSVDAEVEEVFGPRLFTIDEPNWGDLDGEIQVFMPTALAAAVREDDRVTVTGTLQEFLAADVDREWGWLGLEPGVEVDFSRKPVLRAEQLVGGNGDVALLIRVPPQDAAGGGDASAVGSTRGSDTGQATGTSGRDGTAAPIVDVSMLARGDDDLVGRSVSLQQARITAVDPARGYFVSSGSEHIFVLPAQEFVPRLGAGESVRIDGTVLRMPKEMDDRLKAPGSLNDEIYVYATNLRRR